jgi:hypothetical protein
MIIIIKKEEVYSSKTTTLSVSLFSSSSSKSFNPSLILFKSRNFGSAARIPSFNNRTQPSYNQINLIHRGKKNNKSIIPSLIPKQFERYSMNHQGLNDDDHQMSIRDFVTFFQYLIIKMK